MIVSANLSYYTPLDWVINKPGTRIIDFLVFPTNFPSGCEADRLVDIIHEETDKVKSYHRDDFAGIYFSDFVLNLFNDQTTKLRKWAEQMREAADRPKHNRRYENGSRKGRQVPQALDLHCIARTNFRREFMTNNALKNEPQAYVPHDLFRFVNEMADQPQKLYGAKLFAQAMALKRKRCEIITRNQDVVGVGNRFYEGIGRLNLPLDTSTFPSVVYLGRYERPEHR